MSQTRRLAAILAADVAGYSRLMGADESGTLRRIKAIRAQLIDPKIAEHHGRLVKTTGEGLLVEFGSVVDALHFRLGHVGSRGSTGTRPLHEAGDQEGGVCWTDRRNAWPYRR
jgi:class 3 adenylate cyclase